MSEMPTIIETNKDNNNGWGNGWGAGVGGFLGSVFGNGGFGGWGYGGRGMAPGQGVADVTIQNGIQNLSNQAQQNAIATIQASGQTQRQVADTGFAIQGGQYQQTIANLQGQNQQNLGMAQGFAGVGQQICCLGGSLGEKIDRAGDQTVAAINQGVVTGLQTQMQTNDRLCAINGNITNQGYEGRLQTQNTAALLQQQHADLKATIIEQGCQDRETMREIAAQAVRDKLAEANAKIAQLETQGNLTSQLQSQTLYLISQLKPTTTTAAGA